ncbi:hypothetical protein PHLH3_45850 [Pseudomonas sp. St386]|uniref:hypothetical protein n=1 Tax=Pseudomonas TaxID=286 RepID=UPI0005C2CE08|nr:MULTISPECIES: hypothetical protein [Pseudomonas]KIR14252.1 hypothetical protein PFLU4_46920 [Pseudomonas fluorescens]RDI09113.1 hypothetical protein DFO59_101523 [Pseudomonas fluorescens]BBP54959.1 hypothetical protein PHLH3_45850 [Pseudomonas sp. St386]
MDEINVRLHQPRRWLSQSEGLMAQELDFIDEDLASDSLNGLDNVADSLGMLATYCGIRGEVAISDGEASGWEQVSRSMMYRYWALMLKAKAFSKTSFLQGLKPVPNLTNQLSIAGCLLAGLIVADRRDLAASVADVLAGMLTINGAVDSSYLKQRRFEPFMLWLYSVYSQGDTLSDFESMDLGIYQKVIDEWTNEQGLAHALEELCQYHLSNAEDNGGAWDPEFKYAPFDLLPLEIHAIFQVRQ